MAIETRSHGAPTFVRWSSIFVGTVIALATMGLLSALWQALGFSSNVSFFADNIQWFIGGSAVLSLFVGGILAGWLAGRSGAGQGALHGATVWGVLFIAVLVVGVPAAALSGVSAFFNGGTVLTSTQWTVFWSLLIGLGAALTGGTLGGAMPAPTAGDTSEYELVERREREHERAA